MARIVYGTKVFTKALGYYGEKQQCPNCQRVYSKSLVAYKKWAHLEYIPIFPVKTTYYHMCPICSQGYEVDKATAKNMLAGQPVTDQNITMFAKHFRARKPKGLLTADTSYELWVKDLMTNEEICIAANISKDHIKQEEKTRGFGKVAIYEL